MKEIGIEPLNDKQAWQLYGLCMEFQPYTKTDDVVFLEVVKAARGFINRWFYLFVGETPEERFEKLLIDKLITPIKSKYYFNGIKYANRILECGQYRKIEKIRDNPIVGMYKYKYEQREKELFMKVVRACRDYMRAKMSKEAEPVFFERLMIVYKAINS